MLKIDYLKFVQNGGWLVDVPDHERTEEMYRIEISRNSIIGVPAEYLTQEICNKFIFRHLPSIKLIGAIPYQFRTQEMYTRYIKRYPRDPFELNYIPEEFRSKEVLRAVYGNALEGCENDLPVDTKLSGDTLELVFALSISIGLTIIVVSCFC